MSLLGFMFHARLLLLPAKCDVWKGTKEDVVKLQNHGDSPPSKCVTSRCLTCRGLYFCEWRITVITLVRNKFRLGLRAKVDLLSPTTTSMRIVKRTSGSVFARLLRVGPKRCRVRWQSAQLKIKEAFPTKPHVAESERKQKMTAPFVMVD